VETYEAVLEAWVDRTRRKIVDRPRAGPSSVGDLAAALPVSRPAVSQHLTVLRRSGLVGYEELGTRNVYRLDTAGLSELRAWLDGFWEAALDRYAERVRDSGFLEHVVTGWLEPLTAAITESGTSPQTAPAAARLSMAVTRGLLLDLLATPRHQRRHRGVRAVPPTRRGSSYRTRQQIAAPGP
jgi:DNA-binding transcriptional ArsR family regulator